MNTLFHSKFRAPEEYAYEVENEKVDVYSMGNIFYQLIALKYGGSTDDEVVAKKVGAIVLEYKYIFLQFVWQKDAVYSYPSFSI